MRMILTISLLSGCIGHGGLRFPGPTGTLGTDRPSYADSIAEEEEEESGAESAQRSEPPQKMKRSRRAGRQVVRAAVGFIGAKKLVVHGERIRWDCSGFVCASYKKAGHPLRGNTASMQDMAKDAGLFHKRKRPMPGDVVFFHNTYDRNRNGKRDDLWSHVAIVESVDSDGTIHMVHKGGRGVNRLSMNLKRPHQVKDADGKRLNSYLSNHKYGPKLAGELWSGFGSLWALEDERMTSR